MDISRAIKLRKQIQKPNFPTVKLLCTPKEGCTLCIKEAELIQDDDYDKIIQIANENKLHRCLEQGYWILFS